MTTQKELYTILEEKGLLRRGDEGLVPGTFAATLPQKTSLGVPHHLEAIGVQYYTRRGSPTDFYTLYTIDSSTVSNELVCYSSEDLRTYIGSNYDTISAPLVVIFQSDLEALRYNAYYRVLSFNRGAFRTSAIQVPAASEVTSSKDALGNDLMLVHLPLGTDFSEPRRGLAWEFQDLIGERLDPGNWWVLIGESKWKAQLTWELCLSGVSNEYIRTTSLPLPLVPTRWPDLDKLPVIVYPNIKEYLNTVIKTTSLSRMDCHRYATYIMSDIVSRGERYLKASSKEPYYFDKDKCTLLTASVGNVSKDRYHEHPFGRTLYDRYGITANDSRLLNTLMSQYTAGEPKEIEPLRVRHLVSHEDGRGTRIYHQANNGEVLCVTTKGLQIQLNGQEVMFEADYIEELSSLEVLREYEDQASWGSPECWWEDIYESLNVVHASPELEELSEKWGFNVTKRLHTLLSYISPWMLGWNETQLPIEIITGEAGSGKTSLVGLKQNILVGRSKMSQVPSDMRDWHSAIAICNSIMVLDNVHFTSKMLAQRISDELCRVTTDSDPTIEVRRLYTTADTHVIPVRCTFALTALVPPFHNQDILQRSFSLHLNAIRHKASGAHVTRWVDNALEARGGRESWLAHHLLILQHILKGIERGWDEGYMSDCRLINIEQLLRIVAKVFWPKESSKWIIATIKNSTRAEGNVETWLFEALFEFKEAWKLSTNKKAYNGTLGFGTREISDWCREHPEYKQSNTLCAPRVLAKFITSYQETIRQESGIEFKFKYGNRAIYGAVNGH